MNEAEIAANTIAMLREVIQQQATEIAELAGLVRPSNPGDT